MSTDGKVTLRRHERVLDALGDRTRRAIVDLLVERPRSVTELADELPVGRPAVSLHLKVLREAGLVGDTAMGTRRIYSVDPSGLELLRTYLDRVWQGALANFAAVAEAEHRTTNSPVHQGEGMSEQTTTTIDPIVRTVTVEAPVDTCFRTFVDRWATWWPKEHHIGQEREITELHLEGKVGGRAYDVDTTGTECQWGTVLAFEPPHRLVLAWHIQPDFTTIDHDLARSSEVEVTFSEVGDGRTEVRLVHGHLERHGDGAASMHGSVGNDQGGWGFLLGRLADVAEGRAPRALPALPSP